MIPILGMHRSGTSALAGALHKVGADLGPESAWIQSATDNPLGFFEYEPVVQVNRDILAALGGTWSTPPAFPPGWVDDDRVAGPRERAQAVAEELPRAMVVKDPRLSLVQPLWDRVGPPAPAILCVRHPLAVAASLEARNGFDVDAGLYLWFRYNAASCVNRPDALVIHYERLLAEPDDELRRVAEHIGLAPSDHTIEAAAGSLRDSMAHHEGESLPSTPIGDIAADLYEMLLAGDTLEHRELVGPWARLATELPWAGPSDREIVLAEQKHQRGAAEIARLTEENDRLRERMRRLEGELRNALTTLDGMSLAGSAALISGTQDLTT